MTGDGVDAVMPKNRRKESDPEWVEHQKEVRRKQNRRAAEKKGRKKRATGAVKRVLTTAEAKTVVEWERRLRQRLVQLG